MGQRPPELKYSRIRIVTASILGALGVSLLLWNELEAVRVDKIVTTMIEGIHKVSNANLIDEANNNTLIYIYGMIQVEEPLTEPEYGLSVLAVILKRRVQMYQWVEKVEDKSEYTGVTSEFDVYKYDNEWKDKPVDSSKFVRREGHENPKILSLGDVTNVTANRVFNAVGNKSFPQEWITNHSSIQIKEFPVTSHVYLCPNVKIGAYTLSAELKNKFKDFILITSDERPESHDIKMHAGLYYHTADVWNPKVGDIRLQFSYAGNSGEMVSVIATQMGKELGGSDLLLLEKGKVPPSEMISNEHNWNIWLIRLYRTCGWLCLYIGCTFAKSVFYYFGRKYRKMYIFISLDRRLSPYASLSSVVMALIICSVWTVYKPLVGAVMIAMFLSPFIWCASTVEAKDCRNEYKKI